MNDPRNFKSLTMKITPTKIADILYIEPVVFCDGRGFFLESYQEKNFHLAGIQFQFVQDNQSGSKKSTLRGLHYQIRQAQGKIVSCLYGEIFDVAVDLRRSSATFGHWVGTCLSSAKKDMVWIPPGFAHGFYVLGDWAEVFYKTTDYYAPQWERTLRWDDPQLAIQWPLNGEMPILSEKDSQGTSIMEAELYE